MEKVRYKFLIIIIIQTRLSGSQAEEEELNQS